MNVNKAEIKMIVAQDLGKQFEAREIALIAEAHRLEGAGGALKQAIEKLESVKAYHQREVDSNRLEEKNLALVMKVVDQCRGVLVSLGDLANAQKLVKQGEALEARKSLDMMEKMFNDEKTKVEAVLKAVEEGKISQEDIGPSPDGSPALRVVNERPMSDAVADLAARRAAARAERQASETAKVELVPEVKPEQTLKEEPKLEEPKPEEPKEEAVEPEAPMASSEEALPVAVPQPVIPPPRRQVVNRRKKR